MSVEEVLRNSPLADPLALPLLPAETVSSWGRTLVVAPHPDDESLGCGGAIALLRQHDCAVNVLTVSDGTLSHPNSLTFSATALMQLREREMIVALDILGVAQSQITFFRYKDRSVPDTAAIGFEQAVNRFADYLQTVAPATVLVPWRRDPHPDHRASHDIVAAAVRLLPAQPRLIEYPIWLWELATGEDAPRADEVRAWRLDIKDVYQQKQRAIHAHRSQTTDLINDDPTAFRLTPEILEHFARPWEIYLESL